ncbi:MAG: alpha-glucan family phosphorylase [Anaerolineaceae bacterium]|nr:alpha-glucan family phosphorylase [Anaerolineaceae bacterium]
MIKPVARINVVPALPESLRRLQELAYNLRWAWDHDTIALFRRLDRDLWEATGRNPVWMLGLVSQERLNAASDDPAFMAHLDAVAESFDAYMSESHTWYNIHYGQEERPVIAYFSTEFGLTECLQNYSGGLGVLSGDHLKSASDLGLPLVGVGLLYQEGYFHQYLNADGYQQESYPINDYANLPVTLQRKADGTPITISVPMPGRELYALIWKVQVGRIPLFLLDSNTALNTREEDRNLTDRLYGGDRRTRIRQEILMGIGGIRALEALGLRPSICHMNEGHSAFLGLERIRQVMEEHKLSFDQARKITSASHIFTTHTPVPAGLERFGFDLIDEHFTNYYKSLGLNRDQFIDLGREDMGDYQLFSMPVLALNLSGGANGVARLHGVVSRHLWNWMYPNVPENEIPVDSVTNGIHTQTWISREMGTLLDRYLDPSWRNEDARPEIWEAIDQVPDSELWRTHERRRERLVAFTRRRLRSQLENRGAPQHEIEAADEVLNPDALTIGFARRFATYKRATLLFRDLERLKKIVSNSETPVQIIFAGKAHPHDTGGKELIRQIVNIARGEDFRHSIVFLENYDMSIARMMVQGVDVWLNTPQRPKEASGTSGMKVIYNGGLNCSILDGWWAEGYSPELGWAIGNGEEYPEHELERQNYIESEALYNILEKDIIPLFYERGRDGLPREWIGKMKNSMQKLAPYFNTHRMIEEYTDKFYIPSFRRVKEITGDNLQEGVAFAAWRSHLEKSWPQVNVKQVEISRNQIKVGSEVEVNARVDLGDLTPDDVRVQLFYGQVDTRGEIGHSGEAVDMLPVNGEDGAYTFTARVLYQTSGERGISVRVLPYHKYLHTSFLPSLITWA